MTRQLITDFGQIKKGDKLEIVQWDKTEKFTCRDVLNHGNPAEEIIVNLSKNLYFITSKYLNKTSWAMEVYKLEKT